MNISVLDAIHALNELSMQDYLPRPRGGGVLLSHITQYYQSKDGIEPLAKKIIESLRSHTMKDDDMAHISCQSMIAMVAEPLPMEEKSWIIQLLIQWVHITNTANDVLACILQSLRSFNVHFNEVYAIRTAIFNYVTQPELNTETLIEILPDGKLILNPRDASKYAEKPCDEHIFILKQLQKLVSYKKFTYFTALIQYDFARCNSETRCSQISRPISNYKSSGFDMENQSLFSVGFGKYSFSDGVSPAEDLMTNEHNSALEMYQSSMKALENFKCNEKLVGKQWVVTTIEEDSDDEVDEEEQWNLSATEATSDSDSGIHFDSDSSEPLSNLSTPMPFYTKPLPKTIKVQE